MPPFAPTLPNLPRAARPDAIAALRRRLRRRAVAEAGLVGLAVLLAGFVPAAPLDGLRLALVALSLGLLVFVIRRGRDLAALARLGEAQRTAVEARGIPLADWQAGAPLPAWHQRA